MQGLVKSPLSFLNTQVSTNPTELGKWMQEHNLEWVSVYEDGWVTQYYLKDGIARAI